MFPQLSNLSETKGGYLHSDKSLSAEQFEQIVTAIIEGKYSWACVLILRFSGYNPIHYIPYRTYKRLVRDHKVEQIEDPKKMHKNSALGYINSR